MSRVLDALNPQQLAAVQHGDGPVMVLAGAGSGKTRVITRRIAWLLEKGVEPGRILALTFTNKAAGEMAARVHDLGGARVQVSTFHSACARFLRVDGHYLDYPANFSIYDTYDRDACLKQLLQRHEIALGGAVTANRVGSRISRLKNLGVRPEDFVHGMGELDAVVAEIYAPYEARMRELGAMDFDDLLVRFVDLLEEHPAVAEVYQERYRYVLVDEFQDTNLVQYQMIKLLARKHGNVCVVGDPDQSIYKFRGAQIRNIIEFEADYQSLVTYRLERNYRSSGCILAAAQGVIENNEARLEKDLTTDAEFGAPLRILRSDSEQEEAFDVMHLVQGLIRNGTGPEEIAIFYRAHFLSRSIEQALRQEGIGYEIVGGLTFFERREIKDLLAYLRVVLNPLDDVSLLRVINVPPRGVGKTSLDRLTASASRAGLSLFEAICDTDQRGVVSAKGRKGLEKLASVLTAMGSTIEPAEAIRHVLQETNYMEYACGLGDPQDVSREENLRELINDAVEFGKEGDGDLAAYMQHVSLLTSQADADADGAKVQLMTVHSAKGLEFEHVIIIGLEEGTFPHARSFAEPEDMEEERRLMYVAVTRARQTATLSYSTSRMVAGETRRQDMSRFIREIPPECASWEGRVFEGWERDDSTDSISEGDVDYGYDEDLELSQGTMVIHPHYGEGEVLRISGEGMKMRIVVRFKGGREKTLIPEHAKLQIVPGGGSW